MAAMTPVVTMAARDQIDMLAPTARMRKHHSTNDSFADISSGIDDDVLPEYMSEESHDQPPSRSLPEYGSLISA
jgi:hypothetical protein